ncbi:hypothetical protein L195_g061878, partial [Trifolium pratense]
GVDNGSGWVGADPNCRSVSNHGWYTLAHFDSCPHAGFAGFGSLGFRVTRMVSCG